MGPSLVGGDTRAAGPPDEMLNCGVVVWSRQGVSGTVRGSQLDKVRVLRLEILVEGTLCSGTDVEAHFQRTGGMCAPTRMCTCDTCAYVTGSREEANGRCCQLVYLGERCTDAHCGCAPL